MKTLVTFYFPCFLCIALAASGQDTSVPSELAGTWSYTETSVTQYRDRATGSFAPPSGSSSTLEFRPDGSFKSWDLIQQSLYTCSTTIFIARTGHLVVNGPRMMLRYEDGHVSSKDNCHARFNYERAAKPEVTTYDAWTIRMSANGPQLLMSSAGRLLFVYTRKKAS